MKLGYKKQYLLFVDRFVLIKRGTTHTAWSKEQCTRNSEESTSNRLTEKYVQTHFHHIPHGLLHPEIRCHTKYGDCDCRLQTGYLRMLTAMLGLTQRIQEVDSLSSGSDVVLHVHRRSIKYEMFFSVPSQVNIKFAYLQVKRVRVDPG